MIICALVKHELMHISASVLYSVTQTLGVFHCYITRVRESVWFEYKSLRSKFTRSVLLWPLRLLNVLAHESIRHLFFLAYYSDVCGFASLTPGNFRAIKNTHGKDNVFLGLSDMILHS